MYIAGQWQQTMEDLGEEAWALLCIVLIIGARIVFFFSFVCVPASPPSILLSSSRNSSGKYSELSLCDNINILLMFEHHL